MNACFIDEMVVENPHDAVQEFIERYRKNTPFENGSSPNTRYAQPKSDDEVVHARSSSVPTTTQNDTLYCLKTGRNGLFNGINVTTLVELLQKFLRQQTLKAWPIGLKGLFWRYK